MDIRKPANATVQQSFNNEKAYLSIPIDFIVGKQEFRHLTNIPMAELKVGQFSKKAAEVVVCRRADDHPKDHKELISKRIRWPVTISAQDAMGSNPLFITLTFACTLENLQPDPESALKIQITLEFDHGKEIPINLELAWCIDVLVLEKIERTRKSWPLAGALAVLTASYVYLTFWNDFINQGAAGGILAPRLVQGFLYAAAGYVSFAAIRQSIVSAPGLFSFFDFPELDVYHRMGKILNNYLSFALTSTFSIGVIAFTLWQWSFPIPENLSDEIAIISQEGPQKIISEKDQRIRRTLLPAALYCRDPSILRSPSPTKNLGALDKNGKFTPKTFDLEISHSRMRLLSPDCIEQAKPPTEESDSLYTVPITITSEFSILCVPQDAQPAVKDFLCGGGGEAGSFQVWERNVPSRVLRLYPAPRVTAKELANALAAWEETIDIRALGAQQILQEAETYINQFPSDLTANKAVQPESLLEFYRSHVLPYLRKNNADELARQLLRVTVLLHKSVDPEVGPVPAALDKWPLDFIAAWKDIEFKNNGRLRPTFRIHVRLLLEIERIMIQRGQVERADNIRIGIENTLREVQDSRVVIGYLEDSLRAEAFATEQWRPGAEQRRKFFMSQISIFNNNQVLTTQAFQRAAEAASQTMAVSKLLDKIAKELDKKNIDPEAALRELWYGTGNWEALSDTQGTQASISSLPAKQILQDPANNISPQQRGSEEGG